MTGTPLVDYAEFFRAWLSDPLRVASIVPSSRALARAITADISPESGPVIELGVGTGIFTRALLERGVAEDQLVLIEYGSEFVSLLAHRFPRARTLWMDATRLRNAKLLDGKAGAVVSGLPLLSMSPKKVFAILDGAFHHLREDGAFYQFTYGPRCPVPRPVLERLGLEAKRTAVIMSNIPPASVYRIVRKAPRAG
jgi:phosphatidylethanolamine/phosphatidyl-N-methylethanolamine N-methyltransferase